MKVTLSIKQIMAVASFAGLVIDEEKSFGADEREQFLENEFTISKSQKVDLEDGNYYEGMTVHSTEYPEEGYLQLEDKPSISIGDIPNKNELTTEQKLERAMHTLKVISENAGWLDHHCRAKACLEIIANKKD